MIKTIVKILVRGLILIVFFFVINKLGVSIGDAIAVCGFVALLFRFGNDKLEPTLGVVDIYFTEVIVSLVEREAKFFYVLLKNKAKLLKQESEYGREYSFYRYKRKIIKVCWKEKFYQMSIDENETNFDSGKCGFYREYVIYWSPDLSKKMAFSLPFGETLTTAKNKGVIPKDIEGFILHDGEPVGYQEFTNFCGNIYVLST